MLDLLWHMDSLSPDDTLQVVRDALCKDDELTQNTRIDVFYVAPRVDEGLDWYTDIKGRVVFEKRICVGELERFLALKPDVRFVTINVWKTRMVPKNYDVTLWDGRWSEVQRTNDHVCNGCGYRNP